MCLKEIANKNTAWNSVQYHLFYQLDRCQKIQKSNFGNVQDKWIYSGWKNRCRQQTALYTGDWINGLHYNHMYTDLKKVLGINIAFVKHYHIILKIKKKKKNQCWNCHLPKTDVLSFQSIPIKLYQKTWKV